MTELRQLQFAVGSVPNCEIWENEIFVPANHCGAQMHVYNCAIGGGCMHVLKQSTWEVKNTEK